MGLDLSFRLRKLKAMSTREVLTRAAYEGYIALERRRVSAIADGKDLRSPGMSLRGLAEMIASRRGGTRTPRFFTPFDDRAGVRRLFDEVYAHHLDQTRLVAADAREHKFSFFGQRFVYGPEIDWHADPVSRRAWPRVYHRDVPIDEQGRSVGDVKYVWELNRQQFLIDLGKAYWLCDDKASSAAVYSIVRSWIAANPYGVGVNWACALEPAFRVWSWLWAYAFCHDDPALDDQTHRAWLGSFYEHGYFLHRHLEYYTSPFNHLVGEAAALYALGVLFPEFPEADGWRRRGRAVLEEQATSQFHSDGGTVEQSTFYHHATLGFYVLAALIGRINGEEFTPQVWDRMERGIEFSMALVQPDGRVPSIGGADDGKSIQLQHVRFWDFRAFQAIGAVLFRRGDFKAVAGAFPEDAVWLLGRTGLDAFAALDAVTPARQTALMSSGYYVCRSDWSPAADYVCFDCGEQAASARRDDVPSSVHGHADCLSVVLWLKGRAVLVDPGFYCYNGDPHWEVHFRKTGAHNTAVVDGRDQSHHIHKMAWSHVFEPRLEEWQPANGWMVGSHDGYMRGESGVLHRRWVWLRREGYCVICDQFTGSGRHEVQMNYQFAPGDAQLLDAARLRYVEGVEVAWCGSVPIDAVVRAGQDCPDGGWVAPSLGVKAAAPRLTLTSVFDGPVATYLTVLAAGEPGSPCHLAVRDDGEEIAIAVTVSSGTSWVEVPARRQPVKPYVPGDWLRVRSDAASPMEMSVCD